LNGIILWCRRLLVLLAMLLVLVSILPLVQSNEWWIRVWDYPRPQLLVACVITLALHFWLLPGIRHWSFIILIALLTATAFHAWRIMVYTPVWPTEMASADTTDSDSCATVMIANVLMENRESQDLLTLISEKDPDILFIVENDSWWSRELHPVTSSYQYSIDQPQDDTYGLLFMTRLVAEDVQLRQLTDPSIPSVRASLELASGQGFNFFGLHPKPPRFGQDTTLRDHELMVVADEVRSEDGPSIVGGDLNDVAWSHTTRLFKRVSRMLDPRQGRGLFPSYNAKHSWMRWPLDHLFATDDFEISQLSLLRYIGSDHFPVFAEFCIRDGVANNNRSQDQMRGDDREEMHKALESK